MVKIINKIKCVIEMYVFSVFFLKMNELLFVYLILLFVLIIRIFLRLWYILRGVLYIMEVVCLV